jgi:hypothetical protein
MLVCDRVFQIGVKGINPEGGTTLRIAFTGRLRFKRCLAFRGLRIT